MLLFQKAYSKTQAAKRKTSFYKKESYEKPANNSSYF